MPSTWVATCKSLAEIERLIKGKFDNRNIHLTVTQAHVLQALYAVDGQQPTELAKYVGRESTGFTPVLDNLERAKLIFRDADLQDRRAVSIYLTKEGEILAEAVTQALAEVEAEYSK